MWSIRNGLAVALLLTCIACCTHKSVLDSTVYITNTGSKYHESSCRYLGKSCIPVSLAQALSRGYDPCSDCSPPIIEQNPEIGDTSTVPPLPETIEKPEKAPETGVVQCSGITRKGTRCKRMVKDGSGRCYQHRD